MDVNALASEIVAMFKAGQFVEVGDKYWADEVVSVESMMPLGMDPASHGIGGFAPRPSGSTTTTR